MSRIPHRLLIVLSASAVAALAFVSASSPAAKPTQTQIASGLARRVEGARTSTARYQALLAVMKAFRIGVYTSSGRALVRGAERNARDFYLYDFELRAIATALGQSTTTSRGDLATELDHAGVTVHGEPATASALQSAISSGIAEATRRPRRATSLAPLLFRDLGLGHAQGQIDPLQRMILLADLAVASGRLQSGTALGMEKAGSKCPLDDYRPDPHRAGYRIGKWLVKKGFGAAESYVKDVYELVHAVALAHAIDFHEVKQGEVTSTHYGPAGDHPGATGDHVPGQKLVFIVEVDMKVDLAKSEPDLVSCGALFGLKIPPPGPVPGVEIQWKPLLTEGFGRLLEHGTVTYTQTTDSRGQAVLRFTPNDEAIAGFGELRTDTGTLQPGASVLDAFGNEPGGLVEDLTPLFTTLTAWSVEWHQPRGFKFALVEYPPAPSEYFTFHTESFGIEAHVCGADPYAKPWSGTWHLLRTEQDGTHYDDAFGRTFDDWVFRPGQATVPLPNYPDVGFGMGDAIQGTLVRGTPPDSPLMVRLRVKQTPLFAGGPTSRIETVPVQEDESCPQT